MIKFDPLNNEGTSRILFLLEEGIDTPTGLARKLKLGPSAIIDHLRKLQRIHVVQLGEKTGKTQHYIVNKGRLAKITDDRMKRPFPPNTWLDYAWNPTRRCIAK